MSPAVILRSPALRDDEASLYCVCPSDAGFHSLAMVQRERVFRHERGATNAPLRVNDCQFALGFESANLRKNRTDARGATLAPIRPYGRVRLIPRFSLPELRDGRDDGYRQPSGCCGDPAENLDLSIIAVLRLVGPIIRFAS